MNSKTKKRKPRPKKMTTVVTGDEQTITDFNTNQILKKTLELIKQYTPNFITTRNTEFVYSRDNLMIIADYHNDHPSPYVRQDLLGILTVLKQQNWVDFVRFIEID
jgi:hypothetical protein